MWRGLIALAATFTAVSWFGKPARADVRFLPGASIGMQNGAYLGTARVHVAPINYFELGIELGYSASIVEIGDVPVMTALVPIRLDIPTPGGIVLFGQGLVGYVSFGGDGDASGLAYGGGGGIDYWTGSVRLFGQFDIVANNADLAICDFESECDNTLTRFIVGLDFSFPPPSKK
jgi:hypothetical protein